MESLIKIFTNKHTCFYNLFNVRGLETKDDDFTLEEVVMQWYRKTVKNHCGLKVSSLNGEVVPA